MFDRIIFSDNGTLSDISTELEDFINQSAVLPIVAAEDAIFIGSRAPFNSQYIESSVANATASVVSIEYWDGSIFRSPVEVIDETKVAGATLAQSGHITWVPSIDHNWHREDTKRNGSEKVTGLGGVEIYDLYWVKLTFSADLDAGTALSFIGHKFSDDSDLGVRYPDLVRPKALSAFTTGKTDWDEQHVVATRRMIDDLRGKGIIDNPNQLLDRRELRDACVHKVAELIYNSFGTDFLDVKLEARKDYEEALKKDIFVVDKNDDARFSRSEENVRTGRLFR